MVKKSLKNGEGLGGGPVIMNWNEAVGSSEKGKKLGRTAQFEILAAIREDDKMEVKEIDRWHYSSGACT